MARRKIRIEIEICLLSNVYIDTLIRNKEKRFLWVTGYHTFIVAGLNQLALFAYQLPELFTFDSSACFSLIRFLLSFYCRGYEQSFSLMSSTLCKETPVLTQRGWQQRTVFERYSRMCSNFLWSCSISKELHVYIFWQRFQIFSRVHSWFLLVSLPIQYFLSFIFSSCFSISEPFFMKSLKQRENTS